MDCKYDELIKKYVDDHIDEAVTLLETLGKIPAPSNHEEKRAEFCKEWFVNQGAERVYVDEALNVVCEIGCEDHEDMVVFMAHTDVVFPDEEELPMKRDNNILYAPGIGDDTANLVNLMMGAKYLINNQVSVNKGILIVANSGEEGMGNLKGCKEIFKKFGSRIKEFYSFDCYLGHCITGPVGSYRYKVTVKSQGGHSYADFGNENAIYTMSSLIQELYKIEVPKEAKTTYNVGAIEGGTTVNSIAQECSILYEYRSSSDHCLKVMENSFNKIINDFKDKGKDISVEILGVRPGMGEIHKEAFDTWTKKNVSIINKYYKGEVNIGTASTDANIPLSMGIMANTIGTIEGDDAHKREEWVDLNSIPMGMSIVLQLMMEHVD